MESHERQHWAPASAAVSWWSRSATGPAVRPAHDSETMVKCTLVFQGIEFKREVSIFAQLEAAALAIARPWGAVRVVLEYDKQELTGGERRCMLKDDATFADFVTAFAAVRKDRPCIEIIIVLRTFAPGECSALPVALRARSQIAVRPVLVAERCFGKCFPPGACCCAICVPASVFSLADCDACLIPLCASHVMQSATTLHSPSLRTHSSPQSWTDRRGVSF